MGEQRRYRRATSDGYEIPGVARSRDLDRAVERITAHLAQHGLLGQMLVHRCCLLRDWLGLPTDTWPPDTHDAATPHQRRAGVTPSRSGVAFRRRRPTTIVGAAGDWRG